MNKSVSISPNSSLDIIRDNDSLVINVKKEFSSFSKKSKAILPIGLSLLASFIGLILGVIFAITSESWTPLWLTTLILSVLGYAVGVAFSDSANNNESPRIEIKAGKLITNWPPMLAETLKTKIKHEKGTVYDYELDNISDLRVLSMDGDIIREEPVSSGVKVTVGSPLYMAIDGVGQAAGLAVGAIAGSGSKLLKYSLKDVGQMLAISYGNESIIITKGMNKAAANELCDLLLAELSRIRRSI